MVKILLDDNNHRAGLYPFTATRHTADIRVGILTLREKWQNLISPSISVSASFFSAGNELPGANETAIVSIGAHYIPEPGWINLLNETLTTGKTLPQNWQDGYRLKQLTHPWHIFQLNDWALREDYKMITAGRPSQPLSATNRVTGEEYIFLEEGATIEHCIINAIEGPVYIGKNALVMEGTMLRGPIAVGEGAVVKMGSKIYGATTIGPYCTAGGEIKNVVMFGYSNKAHDGYLGDSVIGEWCNLGAGTTNSNLKNTAGEVRVWSGPHNDYIPAGLKCGLLMGDYSRAAINTSFNTGTVAGVGCNIFGEGFPPKFISNFTWGKERYTFDKMVEHINNWKKLKGHQLTTVEINLLHHLYIQS